MGMKGRGLLWRTGIIRVDESQYVPASGVVAQAVSLLVVEVEV
jgi:hypothetical protein